MPFQELLNKAGLRAPLGPESRDSYSTCSGALKDYVVPASPADNRRMLCSTPKAGCCSIRGHANPR